MEKSLNYFKNGFNCSQALLATYATDFGLSEEMALKVATHLAVVQERVKCVVLYQER